jgi:hypothetical protein
MFTKKEPFSWVTSQPHREVMTSDWTDANTCCQHRAYKPAQVMLGAVIEGAVGYAMLRTRHEVPENISLEKLIGLAKESGLLPQGEAYLGQAIRDYRNLVHPQRFVTEGRRPTKETAEVARKACEYVLAELEKQLAAYVPTPLNAYLMVDGGYIAINKTPFTVGRAEDNSCVITASSISAHHARITCASHIFYLEDLKSTNGTSLMMSGLPKQVKPGKLMPLGGQSHIRLGKKDTDPQVVFGIEGEEGMTTREK